MKNLSRRTALRGLLNGGAITVGLPLLDCFLNSNGNAFADGKPMPIRFGTWSWGLGITYSLFEPKKYGKDFDFPEEIESLKPFRDKINILTKANAFRDGAPQIGHQTSWIISRTGSPPNAANGLADQTWDVKIANQIGRQHRFKTLTATAAGNARASYSFEDPNTINAAEFSPLNFYTRLFGADFTDPNAEDFKPNPLVMARKGVLSAVMDDMQWLDQRVGAADKQRLDQYFTGLRHLEKQFDQKLTKPEPIAACHPVKFGQGEVALGQEAPAVIERNKMMSQLLAMAVACDQTRVINMSFDDMSSNVVKPGWDKPHHTTTHEEPIDEKLGYQPIHSWFARRKMEGLATFLKAMSDIKEGDGTLLDNMLIVVDTDHGNARLHAMENIPMFTAGRAGGKVKTGLHIDMKGTPMARLALTAMRVAGLEIQKFGGGTNLTSDSVSEILV